MAQSKAMIDMAFASHPMASWLTEIDRKLQEPQNGEIRNGIIVDKRANEVLVDIGFKSEGVVTSKDLERVGNVFAALKVGDEIPVCIVKEDKDGQLQLSISKAMAERDWETAEMYSKTHEIAEVIVESYNRGGIIARLGQVRGFIPASQLSSIQPTNQELSDEDAARKFGGMVNQSMKVKVIDLDRKRNRLILSERLAMREWRKKQKEQLLDTIKEGDTCEGVISSVADFGAFVDLGGADGLIHLSEMSWNRIAHPNEIVRVGDRVKVQVMNIDGGKSRIGLSLRRLQPQPWEVIQSMFEIGQVVHGRITKLVNFGAFARLDSNGVEGLIHISELSDRRVTHPKEVVTEGDEYDLRIIRIDADKRRLGLSLKQALPPEQKVELDWAIAPSDNNQEISLDEQFAQAESMEAIPV